MSQTIDQFNATLARYATFTRLTPAEVIAKQGSKLGYILRGKLSKLAPAKGVTREARRAAMQAGAGIRVRPGAIAFAKKKTMATATNLRTRKEGLFMERTKAGNVKRNGRSFWAIAIDRELSIRESGRGYLSLAGRMRWTDKAIIAGSTYRVVDRLTREVGRAGMTVSPDGATLRFDYSNPNIIEGLDRVKGKEAIDSALKEANADVLLYINRKIAENAKKAGLN